MNKHTPGPWDIYFNAQDDLVIRKMFPDGQESHVVAHCHSGFDNARLIAAAPELLEALKTLLNLNDNYSSFGGEIHRDRIDRAWDNARAALAKARGKK